MITGSIPNMDTKNDGWEKSQSSKIYLFWVSMFNFGYVYIYNYIYISCSPNDGWKKHNRMQLKGHLLHVLSAVDFGDPGATTEERLCCGRMTGLEEACLPKSIMVG